MIRFVAVLAGLLMLASCGEKSSDDDAQAKDGGLLAGHTFVVTSIDNGGEPWGLAQDSEARITFDDTTMGITAGCNHLA